MDWDLGIDLSRQNDVTDDDEVAEVVMNEHKHPKAEASSMSEGVAVRTPREYDKDIVLPRAWRHVPRHLRHPKVGGAIERGIACTGYCIEFD